MPVSGGTIDGTIGGISVGTNGVTSCGIIVDTSAQNSGICIGLRVGVSVGFRVGTSGGRTRGRCRCIEMSTCEDGVSQCKCLR